MGAVSVAGRVIQVSLEPAPSCALPVIRLSRTRFDAAGGPATADISVGPGCPWTLKPAGDFVSIRPLSGLGAGSAEVFVSPNRTSAARTAAVSAGGASIPITQDAPATACEKPSARLNLDAFGASGGPGILEITGQPGCQWAIEGPSWVKFSVTTGDGSVKVNFTVSSNSDSSARTGRITVAALVLDIKQGRHPEPAAANQ